MKKQGSAAPLPFHPLQCTKALFPSENSLGFPQGIIEPKGAALPWVQ
jgi:hypothetical protein